MIEEYNGMQSQTNQSRERNRAEEVKENLIMCIYKEIVFEAIAFLQCIANKTCNSKWRKNVILKFHHFEKEPLAIEGEEDDG